MIARPEYVPAGHRTHAVLAGTSEYVPAAHEQHALVAFSPSSVAFPVWVSRVFVFQFQGHRGQAPSFITGPTDVRLKRAAYLSRSCILEHTSHFLSRRICQLSMPRMCRHWVPCSLGCMCSGQGDHGAVSYHCCQAISQLPRVLLWSPAACLCC